MEIADRLEKIDDSGFVILSIVIAYIEGNQQFREGEPSYGTSKKKFITGIRRIFNKQDISEEVLIDYYKQIRCGLFHDGMTKENVFISGDFKNPLSYNNGVIMVNPKLFLDAVKNDFENYIDLLKYSTDNSHLRRFTKRYNLVSKKKKKT